MKCLPLGALLIGLGPFSLLIASCGGGGGSAASTVVHPAETYTAKSGVAQKGPLIKASMVTAQELDSSLSPTGQEFTYQTTSDFGTFSPTSTFSSPYIGVIATGYYFDEVANAVSTGPVTLNAYTDLSVDSAMNVNLLTTLEYQRIQKLVTSGMTFTAARTEAENEVLAALNIPAGSYGSFDSLDLSGDTDGDQILMAISAIFVYGNSAGPLSELIANFQSDIGANGVITNAKTAATLVASAKAIDPAAVAANLTAYYASEGVTFAAADITEWIAQSGDAVIGRFAFQVPDATPSTIFTFPSYVVSQFAGTPVSVTAGQLSVNSTLVSGAASFKVGDVVTLSPGAGDFPNGVLTCYLVTGKTNLSRVAFVSGLLSIVVTPNAPSVPLGLTQQLTATGTFSDTSTANLTSSVNWTSGTPATATVGANSGLADTLAAGFTMITATSGSVSASTTLTVTPAILESIAITPNPALTDIGIASQLTATGTYSDGSTENVTSAANWVSSVPSVATVGPTTGLVTGVSLGSTMISATIGLVTENTSLAAVSNTWSPGGATSALPPNGFSTFSLLPGLTATLLANGNVLVAGGGTPLEFVASAEIYNAAAQAWSPAASMSTVRGGQTATLLPNGTVLVTGGSTCDCAGPILASAEIYDPVANTWTLVASMITPRTGHTATLLPNGTVLVVGGLTDTVTNTYTANTEIYDPVANTWTAAASTLTALGYQTATFLTNGTVLIAGGTMPGGSPNTETYDPVANTWSSAGDMSTTRIGHTATLLPNGDVLVAGGSDTTSADLYNPVTNTWSPAANMTMPRSYHTSTLLTNGTVLAAGGINTSTGTITATTEIYDPVANTWTPAASMLAPSDDNTATLLTNGVTLVAGEPATGTIEAELYYP
jgi:hypothetical protein